jgi:hypothetical protein
MSTRSNLIKTDLAPNKILAYLNDRSIESPFSDEDEFFYKHHDGYMLYDKVKSKLQGLSSSSDEKFLKDIEETTGVHGDVEYVVVYDNKFITEYKQEYIEFGNEHYPVWILFHVDELFSSIF